MRWCSCLDSSALGLVIVAELVVVVVVVIGPEFWCMSFQMELTTKDSSKEHLSDLDITWQN